MTVIGSASIDIRANDRYFEPDVRRAVSKIKDLKVDLRVNADMSAANKKLRDLRYRLSNQEVSIKIRANDSMFDADVRAAVRKIKNVGIDLKVDADISAASKKIRDLRYRTTQNDIKISIGANDANFEKDVRAAVRRLKNLSIDLKADVDIANASKKIRDLRYRITSNTAILKVDANLAKAEEKMKKFLEKFTNTEVEITAKAHTAAAHTALSDLQSRYGRNINFTATADTRTARAALATVARNRRAKISAFFDPTSMAALQGAFNTLTGTLPFDKVRTSLSGIAANFEGIAVKAGVMGTAMLSVGDAALVAGANILSIGGDISQVAGIAAMLPAIFIALGTTIAANKMAWKGFGEALSSDPKKAAAAMAELPWQANEAANAIRGMGKEIQKATQVEFWVAMESTLQDMVTTLFPEFLDGMKSIGSSLGAFEAQSFNGISEAFDDGVLLGILENVADMLMNMGEGVKEFIQGIATLGRVGATYLPQFGTYLADAGKKFGDFIQKADEAGKINQWIETSVRRFQELTSVVGSTVDIMGGLTKVARMSGAAGLTEMADGFKNIAAVVNGEPFQSRLLAVLEGARNGMDAMGDGLRTVTDLFGRSAESMGSFLELGGQIAGLTFKNITALFDGTGLGSGLYSALQGLKTAMGDLGPGFRDLGGAIGDLGMIAGTLFESMAPGLNMLAETIAAVIGGLRDGVIDAMPVFNEFMQAILGLVSGPLGAMAEGVGNMLTVFSQLPGVIQTVIMSLGLFIALKTKFGGFFAGISKSLTDENTRVGQTFLDMQTRAEASGTGIRGAFRIAGAGIGQSVQNGIAVATGGMSNMRGNLENLASSTLRTGQATATGLLRIGQATTSQLGALGKGAIGALGGGWGLALMGATVALGAYAQAQAESKARVDELTTALSAQAGEWNSASEDMLATNLLDGATNAWDDFYRGVIFQSKSIEESFSTLGISAKDVSKELADSSSRDKYLASWDKIKQAMMDGKPITEEMAAAVGSTSAAFDDMSNHDMAHIRDEMEGVAEEAAKAEARAKALADTFGTSTIEAQKLAANYKVLEDQTSSVSDKFSALKSNLDIMNNGTRSAADASSAYQQSLRDTSSALTEIGSRQGVVMANLYDTATGFDFASQAGTDLYKVLGDSADAILLQATTAFDVARKGGASMEDATVAASNAMAKPMETFRASLASWGFLPDQIEAIVTQFGLIPETVETALYADGDQAIMEAARTQLMVQAYAEGKYDAVLGALPTSAKEAIGEAMGMTEEFTDGHYEAILKAFDDTPGGREAAMAALATFDGTDWEAFLIANNLIPEEIEKANSAAGDLVKEKSMDIVANDLASLPLQEVAAFSIDGKTVKLTAEDNVSDMLSAINGSPLMDKGSELTATDLVTRMVQDLNAKQLNGKMTTFEVEDLVSDTMKEIDAKTIDGKLVDISANDLASMVIANLNDTTFTDKDILVKVSDTASSILSTINAYEVGDKSLTLSTTDNVSHIISDINASPLADKQNLMTTEDLVSQTVRDINAQQLDGKLTALQANDLVTTTMAAINEKNLDDKSADFTGVDLASLILEQINSTELNSKEMVATTTDLATGVLVGVNNFNIDDKDMLLSVTDSVTSVMSEVNDKNLLDKENQLTTTDLVSDIVNVVNAKQLDRKLTALEGEDLVTGVMNDINSLTLNGKAAELTAVDLATLVVNNLNEMSVKDHEAKITMKDLTAPGAESAKVTVNNAISGMGGGGGVGRSVSGAIDIPLSATDNTAPGVGSAQATMDSLYSVVRDLQAQNMTEGATAASQATMETLQSVMRDLSAQDLTGGTVVASQATMDTLHNVMRDLEAQNMTGTPTAESQATMETLQNVIRNLEAVDATAMPVASAQGTMETLQSVMRDLQAQDTTGGATLAAQGTMSTLQNVMRDLQAQNTTGGPLQASQATMNSLQNVMRDLQAQNLTGGPKGAAQGTMDSLQSVMRDLNANNQVGGPVGAAQGQIDGVHGTEVDIVANDYASGPAENAAAAIGRVVGRTVDIVTNFVSKHFNAEGGFYNGAGEKVLAKGGIIKDAGTTAVQAFANGGVARGPQQQAIKAFAGGGTENHTAQIARGAWPVRIWAEPETGGEAYIPLSPNKRKRSLLILKEVMKEFGLEHLTGSFADGGINKMSRATTPTVISSRYAAASTRSVNPVEQSNTQMAAPIINVHPSQGLNEEQIGVIASDQLWFHIQNSSF